VDLLNSHKVQISAVNQTPPFWLQALGFLLEALPFLFLLGLFYFGMRAARGQQQGLFGFGQSKAKVYTEERPSTTFADVAGVDAAKAELGEVVDFLRHPAKYQRIGARIPKGVLLLGPPGTGTNRPDVLDPALLRPGRFDRQITVEAPDRRGREAILRVHTRKVPLAAEMDLAALAAATPGMSAADLANLVNEAALGAARCGAAQVTQADFEHALDRITLGVPGSPLMSEEERRTVAYHEGGHALVALMLPNVDPVHRVTITPRGRSLGVTQFRPLDDRRNYRRDYLLNRMAVGLGGRAAEEVACDEIASGAQNDLQHVTEMARTMVMQLGMAEELSPRSFGGAADGPLGGRMPNPFAPQEYSEETARRIDAAIDRLLEEAHERALTVLRDNRATLDAIAAALMRDESLDREELTAIVNAHRAPGQAPLPVPTGPPTELAGATG
jgi:cell division protease FtsH